MNRDIERRTRRSINLLDIMIVPRPEPEIRNPTAAQSSPRGGGQKSHPARTDRLHPRTDRYQS